MEIADTEMGTASEGTASEAKSRDPLTSRKTERILGGFEMEIDDGTWHWFLTVPLATDDQPLTESQPDPIKTAEKMFTQRAHELFAPTKKLSEEMTKREFKNAIVDTLVEIFSGDRCGFKVDSQISMDEDEMFILLELENKDTRRKICNRHEMRVQLKKEAYPKDSESGLSTCPTMKFENGEFDNSAGVDACPAYMRYVDSETMRDKFKDFEEKDIIKMMELRMNSFVNIDKLIDCGLVTNSAPVHRRDKVKKLRDSGWSDPWNWLHFPAGLGMEVDAVRDYLGSELAFLFLFINHFTRTIAFVGVLGFVVFFRFLVFKTIDERRVVQYCFAFIMIIWAAYFNASFKQKANRKSVEWGVNNLTQDAVQIRSEYNEKKRGTVWEMLQVQLHWILAFCVMLQTIGFIVWINKFRLDIMHMEKHDPDGVVLGFMSPAMARKVAKYAITANIKIVDYSWSYVSPILSKLENWRTPQALKSATINKLFAVKALVFYYPFFFIAFAQDYVGGCGTSDTACMDLLSENLVIMFATQVLTVLATVVFGLGMSLWKIRSEIKGTAKKPRKSAQGFTYLHMQAKLSPYSGDTDDFMDLVLSLGFVLMFAVVLPFLAFAAFLLVMVEKQLLAFKVMEVSQRAVPALQEGIGAWAQILQMITAVGVVSNVGISVFQMYPLCRYSNLTKIIIFVAAENAFLLMNILIQACFPPYDVSTQCIIERQAEYADDIMGDEDRPCKVDKTLPKVPKDNGPAAS